MQVCLRYTYNSLTAMLSRVQGDQQNLGLFIVHLAWAHSPCLGLALLLPLLSEIPPILQTPALGAVHVGALSGFSLLFTFMALQSDGHDSRHLLLTLGFKHSHFSPPKQRRRKWCTG